MRSCAQIQQVLRETRLRQGNAGSAFSEKEMEDWHGEVERFFAKRRREKSEDLSSAKAKDVKRLEKNQRLASYDLGVSLDHSYRTFLKIGLGHFLNADGVPRSLTWAMDQCAVNWAVFFLRNHVRLAIEGVPDTFHRRSNDADGATTDAGYQLVAAKIHICNNVAYGPWLKGTIMRDLEVAGKEMSVSLSKSHPLLLYFWPSICEDNGWTQPEQTDSRAREDDLLNLPNRKCFFTEGSEVFARPLFQRPCCCQASRPRHS